MSIYDIYATQERLVSKCQIMIIRHPNSSAKWLIDRIQLSFGPSGIYGWQQSKCSITEMHQMKKEFEKCCKISLAEAAALLQDAWMMNQRYHRLPPVELSWLYSLIDMDTSKLNRQHLFQKLTVLPQAPEKFLMACLDAMLRFDWFFYYDIASEAHQKTIGKRDQFVQDGLMQHCTKEIYYIDIERMKHKGLMPRLVVRENQSKQVTRDKVANYQVAIYWQEEPDDFWLGRYSIDLQKTKDGWALDGVFEQSTRQLSVNDPSHPQNKRYTCQVYKIEPLVRDWLVIKLAGIKGFALSGESEHCLIYHEKQSVFQGGGLWVVLLAKELWLYSDNLADLHRVQYLLKLAAQRQISFLGKCRLSLKHLEERAAAGESLKNKALSIEKPLLVFDLDNQKVEYLR